MAFLSSGGVWITWTTGPSQPHTVHLEICLVRFLKKPIKGVHVKVGDAETQQRSSKVSVQVFTLPDPLLQFHKVHHAAPTHVAGGS